MTQHPTPPTQGPQRPGCTCTRHSDTGKSPGAVQGMASRYSVLPHTHNGASPQGPHSAFGRGRGRCPSFITNADTHLGHHRDRQRRRQRRHLLATPRTHTEGQKGSMKAPDPTSKQAAGPGGGGHAPRSHIAPTRNNEESYVTPKGRRKIHTQTPFPKPRGGSTKRRDSSCAGYKTRSGSAELLGEGNTQGSHP